MTSSLLSIATSGLNAYQLELNTTSNNISNASTPGYSVEKAQLAEQPGQQTDNGIVGSGVNVDTVSRGYNQFLNAQLLSTTAAYNGSNTYYTMASQIDNMIADQNAGMSASMSSFFNAASNVANDPSSVPSRQVLLTDANSLASQFNSVAGTLSNLTKQVNGNLTTSVTQLNSYATTLAQLNTQIVSASGNGSGQPPNALLDQRETLLNQISQLANVSVLNQPNGAVSVFIGQGQALVNGATAATLAVQSSTTDPSHLQVTMNGQDISNYFTGGAIAGNIQFRDEVLDPAQQQLGLLATGMAAEVNSVQQSGFDLNGQAGIAMFNVGTPNVQVNGKYSDSNLVVNTSYVPPTTYQLQITGTAPNTYSLTNQSTNTTVTGLTDTTLATTAAADGFSLGSSNGNLTNGEIFPAIANLGSAYQLQVTGTSPSTTFSLTNLSNNTTVSGLTNATLGAAAASAGFSINFSGGKLTTGDTFQISPSYNAAASIQVNPALTSPDQIAAATTAAGAPGDNSNALALAQLQTEPLLYNGSSTFSQVYSQLVAGVGANTNAAQLNSTAQNTVMQNATAAQQSVSGVNLNQEASNLIQYQNAYQAAAKTITVAEALFTALIGAMP